MAFCDWWRIRNETTNKRRQQEQELREVEDWVVGSGKYVHVCRVYKYQMESFQRDKFNWRQFVAKHMREKLPRTRKKYELQLAGQTPKTVGKGIWYWYLYWYWNCYL